ncbi:MAG TPA: sigma-70 family RNA polymerase sigma factor [Solirubrobacterales bacterium]|nr:sigma-70 family RNA polymerase sigma factor [Solirubrobacterales bacterium]
MGAQGTTTDEAARKRAAVEMIARHEAALRRTARRYSFDAEDAEDAFQRALEIALTKAPTTDPRELIRWTQTVTKHEALAVRQSREKLLGYQPRREGEQPDPVASIPARGAGPAEQVERREDVARSREALQALKPAELQALGLLAEGYSYAEIGEMTGWTRTKINRLLAEGRAHFRSFLASSEDGGRCRELQPLLSTFCDGEADSRQVAIVREHLRACAHCRATVRTYRAAPRIAGALLPLLPPSRSLWGRAQELGASLWSRLPGTGGESVATQVAAAGGSRGAGMAALAKLLTVCAGAAGGAACVATGVLPAPLLEQDHGHARRAAATRPAAQETAQSAAVEYEPAPGPDVVPSQEEEPHAQKHEQPPPNEVAAPESSEATAGAIEYEPPPPVESSPPPTGETSSSSGSAAGEFGP